MSTKASIFSNEDSPIFHLYHEAFDTGGVYLELSGADIEFEAEPGSIIVRIPSLMWEVIRHHHEERFNYVGRDDEELLDEVRDYVDWRKGAADEARSLGHEATMYSLLGSIPYGPETDPYEHQLARGLHHAREERMRQEMVLAKVKAVLDFQEKEREESRQDLIEHQKQKAIKREAWRSKNKPIVPTIAALDALIVELYGSQDEDM